MRPAALAILLTCGPAFSQTPGQPAFEAASVKLHPGEITISVDPAIRGRRVVSTASTLLDLITYAYRLRYEQISGGPSWAGTLHYDIQATAGSGDAPLTPEESRRMVQSLLDERFQLRSHRVTVEIPVYALVVAKGGPKIKEAASDATGSSSTRGDDKGLHMDAKKGTMEGLARQLSGNSDKPVVDRTGLAGFYVFKLDWYPANRVPAQEIETPSMFRAVEELGLKLEQSKGTMEKLVIDRAEKPSEN